MFGPQINLTIILKSAKMFSRICKVGLVGLLLFCFLLFLSELYRSAQATGAAKLKYDSIYNSHYLENEHTKLKFSDFKLRRRLGRLGGQMMHQYIWTYSGDEDISPWNEFSVFLSPDEDRIWVDQGSSF